MNEQTSKLSLSNPQIAKANRNLHFSAKLWLLVAVIGQWIFALYVLTTFGSSTLQGNFEQWNEALPHGYVAGDPMGNIAVGVHLFLAFVIMVGGPLQLLPTLRTKAPRFHRWNGRLYVTIALIISLSGLYMVWTRGTVGDFTSHISISINAVLIILCSFLTWRFAVAREMVRHQRWALRLFLVVNGVWFFRIGLMFWLLVNGGEPVGIDFETFTGPFLTFLGFAQYLLPLAFLEWYFRAQEQDSIINRNALTGILLVATLVTAIGIFGATMGMWFPS